MRQLRPSSALPRLARLVGLLAVLQATHAAPAPAQGIQAQGIQAVVDRTEATLRDRLLLQLEVTGSSARPQLPDLPDFQVVSAGQAQRFNMINGRTSSSTTYSYALLPRRTGEFTIGPATVEIEGRTYQSDPIRIRIVEASEQSQASRDLFVQARVSTRTPYVGQQVIYTWQLLRRVRIANARLEPMEFEGFVVEDLGQVREYETTVNGLQYAVSEIRKAIFPQEEGKVVIPESLMSCDVAVRTGRSRGNLFDDFFGRTQTESQILRSPAIELDVRPLPPASRGFSGLIGDFEIRARISRDELKVGESTRLQLTISGTGNVQMIGAPPLGEADFSGFKVYEERPTTDLNRGGNALSGSKTFGRDLVPLKAGELTLPAIPLVYFDPDDGIYRTDTAPAITLSVSPGDGNEDPGLVEGLSPTTGKVEVRILADDILPIYKGLEALSIPNRTATAALWLGGFGLPPLAFLALWLAHRRRRRFEADAGLRRRKGALRRAQQTLAETRQAASRGETATATALASRGLREYIGDKLGVEGSALTPAEAAQLLAGSGLEADLVQRVRRSLEGFEAAQYGAPRSGAEAGEAAAEVDQLIKDLERALAARGR